MERVFSIGLLMAARIFLTPYNINCIHKTGTYKFPSFLRGKTAWGQIPLPDEKISLEYNI